MSRTAPSSPPSHFSSSRSGSSHAGSTTERNVRRSERMRRVATRAWCTSSGSVPRRTPGIVREQPRRRADDGPAQHLGRGRREVEPRRGHEVGRVERAGPQGAGDLRQVLGSAGPGFLQPVGDERDDLLRPAVGEFHLQLAEIRCRDTRRRAPSPCRRRLRPRARRRRRGARRSCARCRDARRPPGARGGSAHGRGRRPRREDHRQARRRAPRCVRARLPTPPPASPSSRPRDGACSHPLARAAGRRCRGRSRGGARCAARRRAGRSR